MHPIFCISLGFHYLSATLEGKMRLGNKKKRVFFVLLSAFITFVSQNQTLIL